MSQGPGEGGYMNRATCGLQTLPDPPSDNLTPQESTNPDSPDMGRDGTSLSCPGSSVVADDALANTDKTIPQSGED